MRYRFALLLASALVWASMAAPASRVAAGRDDSDSVARKRAAQAVAEAREAEQVVRSRAVQSLQDARDAEQTARRRADAAAFELRRAISEGRSARAVEDAKEADALARKRLAQAAEDIQEAQRLGEKRIAQAVEDLRHAEERFATMNSGAPSVVPVRPPVASSRPVEPPGPPAPNGRSSRRSFSLRIFEAVRFPDGTVVKSGGQDPGIQFTYQMRRGMAFVYLGAEQIREFGNSPARFRPADAAGWKDYILGPAPGYYGVVSRGKAYLVHIESYENQGKAASYWKLNGTWEALD